MPLIVPNVSGTKSTSADPTTIWNNLLVGKKLASSGAAAGESDASTIAKKDLPQNHRVIQDGGMATADFQEGRMNLHLDQDGKVKKITHG